MGKEIEYKFLVDTEKWEGTEKPEPQLIIQSYLQNEKERSVRVRVKGDRGFLTIKGATEGVTRTEYEYEIPVSDVEEMIARFQLPHIRKLRYEIQVGDHVWEVDVFEGALEGLVLAEVEVQEEGEAFTKPTWVTEDVSTNPAYYNAVLIGKC
ncbi:MAG: CYTH domain-containing protein [bacterium]|nr:CYTH domain-containing protein [bacterium]